MDRHKKIIDLLKIMQGVLEEKNEAYKRYQELQLEYKILLLELKSLEKEGD